MKSDNEIIKALNEADGLYHISIYCGNRKGEHIASIKMTDIIDLINRQESEIQKAKAELKEITEKFNCQQYVYADLSDIIREKNAEIERLKLITTSNLYCVSIGTADIFTENHEEYEKLLARISAEAIKEFEKALRIEISEAIKSNRRAKQQRINRLNEKGVVCNDEFCSYCDGKIHALCGIGEFVDNLVKEKVGDAE